LLDRWARACLARAGAGFFVSSLMGGFRRAGKNVRISGAATKTAAARKRKDAKKKQGNDMNRLFARAVTSIPPRPFFSFAPFASIAFLLAKAGLVAQALLRNRISASRSRWTATCLERDDRP
jgi:hypothetical protein